GENTCGVGRFGREGMIPEPEVGGVLDRLLRLAPLEDAAEPVQLLARREELHPPSPLREVAIDENPEGRRDRAAGAGDPVGPDRAGYIVDGLDHAPGRCDVL